MVVIHDRSINVKFVSCVILALILIANTTNLLSNEVWGQSANQTPSNDRNDDNCGINPFSPPCLQNFSAQLNGSSEIPPVDTQAGGSALFTPISNETGQALQYDVDVIDMSTITAAHIHNAEVGENGPVIVTLLDKPGIIPCCVDTITADNLEGQLQGKSLVDLIKMMLSGQTHVNVHSQQYPDGEIRGQKRSSSNTTTS